MLAFRLAIYASLFVLGLSLLQLLLLRVLNSVWWRKRWVRRSALGLTLVALVSGLIWVGGAYWRAHQLVLIGSYGASFAAVFSLGLCGSLLVSGLINTPQLLYRKRVSKGRAGSSTEPHSPERRVVLQRVAAAVPLATLGLATTGLARSFSETNVHRVEMAFANLPWELDGFRILHVSDSHLGPYIDLDDVEAMLLDAERYNPDLVLISGDIADHLDLLPGALKLIEGLHAPYGAYACMGNHDYYRGPLRVMGHFDKSSIPMLINRGVTVRVGEADLFIGGADDPRYMGQPIDSFMKETIDKTLTHAGSGSFKVMMSHRPTGFDRAAEQGVELTVAGHTHGGQIGFLGKPVFARWGQEKYVRGKYRIGASQLYTSSGVGHWFPFRLGCPTEAPVIELKRLP